MHAQHQPKVHIRMTHTKPGSENGIHIKTFNAGEEHHVCKDLARIFLEEGWAELASRYVPTMEEVLAAGYSPEVAAAIIERETAIAQQSTEGTTESLAPLAALAAIALQPTTDQAPTTPAPPAADTQEVVTTVEESDEAGTGEAIQLGPEGMEPVKTRKGKKT